VLVNGLCHFAAGLIRQSVAMAKETNWFSIGYLLGFVEFVRRRITNSVELRQPAVTVRRRYHQAVFDFSILVGLCVFHLFTARN